LNTATKSYILDANALLDFAQAGPGFGKVEPLFQAATRQQAAVLVSVANLGEVLYLAWQREGEEEARRTVAKLSRLPIHVVPIDLQQALEAAELKARHKIPYVDCIAAALALQQHATLVTADRDFEKLGRQFPILWLPRR